MKHDAHALQAKGITPHLGIVLVGNNKASETYVGVKKRAAEQAGITISIRHLPKEATTEEVISAMQLLQTNSQLHGLIVQLPLPDHINANKVTEHISPYKDIDGFHSENIGKLMQNKAHLRPCTPKGIMTMLDSIGCEVWGKNCVVVGASNIVGRPMAMELLNVGGTVTICNSKTKDIPSKVKQADIVVVGVGIPKMVKGDWVKEGAVVIDVGINRLEDGSLVGDVDFDAIKDKAGGITPVPGGVGPMTIATLLENTLIAYKENF